MIFTDNIRIKLSKDKENILLSIRENETKASLFIVPRKDFEKAVMEYNSMIENKLLNVEPIVLNNPLN